MSGNDHSVHIPVLLAEVLDLFQGVKPGATIVDCTLGAAGHSRALLEADQASTLLAFDRDPEILGLAKNALKAHHSRVQVFQEPFSALSGRLADLGDRKADFLIADLGASSLQFDSSHRGFSFQQDGPLDMRMGSHGESALQLLSRLSAEEIAKLLRDYGDERFAWRIAKAIRKSLEAGELETTADLREICKRAYPKGRQRIDPATRTFQAIRIAVNDEMGELETLLQSLPDVMAPMGRAVIISFHSAEDRAVKWAFKKYAEDGRARLLTKKPKTADEHERGNNPRSRSAKLRAMEWLEERSA